MFKPNFWIPFVAVVFLGHSSVFAYTEAGDDSLTCTSYETAQATCPPYRLFSVPDTINAVVIYCKSYYQSPKLPSWAIDTSDNIWHERSGTVRNTVPAFYEENTNGKLKLITKAYGPNGLIDGEAKDTLAFLSDSPILPIAPPQPGGGSAFFNNIFSKADQVIDFSQFVESGDTFVTMVFFHIIDADIHWGLSNMVPLSSCSTKLTNDTLPNGKPVYLHTGITASTHSSYGRGAAVGLLSHEFGHRFKDFIRDSLRNAGVINQGTIPFLQDLHGRVGGTSNYWGVGNFSVMGISAGFQFRPSPLDPYHRTAMGLTNLVTVNNGIYSPPVPDYFSSDTVYKLKADNREYFLVSNHKVAGQTSFWEDNFPGNGLLVWHVVDSLACPVCEEHKNVDVESPRGLYNLTNPSTDCQSGNNQLDFNNPNDSLGNDSLDQKCFFFSSYPSGMGSGGFFWNDSTKQKFNNTTNPSSRAYQYVSGLGWVQNRATQVAVEGIKGFGGNMSVEWLQGATANRVSTNTTWGPGIVQITGDLLVDSAVTLTLQPGTTVKFTSDGGNKSELVVKGTLSCVGTVDDSIIFTSSSATPANGDWGGMIVPFPGRANIEFARFSYADTALAIRGDTSTVIVYNSTFTNFSKAAVSSRSYKTRLGGLVPNPNPPDCGRNNFLMSTASSGAYAVIKSSSPTGTLKAEGNW